jgi:hypothetical protein
MKVMLFVCIFAVLICLAVVVIAILADRGRSKRFK